MSPPFLVFCFFSLFYINPSTHLLPSTCYFCPQSLRNFCDLAHLLAPMALVCITSEDDLDRFNAIASSNSSLTQRVGSLEIRISRHFPRLLQKAKQLLSGLAAIDTLIIKLPPVTCAQCVWLFDGLHLPNLSFLSTDSLPHNGVIGLLKNNRYTAELSLGECDTCDCSSGPVDVSLLHLLNIAGPTSCISRLINQSPLTRATAGYGNAVEAHHEPLFRALQTTSGHLTYLELEFSLPQDRDILTLIGHSAPFLVTLKLKEVHTHNQERHRYPWAFSLQWSNDLRKSVNLTHFSLRTAAPLVRRIGNKADEKRLVLRWSGETQKCPRQLSAITIGYCWEQQFRHVTAGSRYRTYDQVYVILAMMSEEQGVQERRDLYRNQLRILRDRIQKIEDKREELESKHMNLQMATTFGAEQVHLYIDFCKITMACNEATQEYIHATMPKLGSGVLILRQAVDNLLEVLQHYQ
ncbi:hypothetical protein FPV67DRAFT_1669711 [Lyophyllum atratum]|nr:hypothetical protein FPV67DRAFT_1669711 [Lyophyllum atratum]